MLTSPRREGDGGKVPFKLGLEVRETVGKSSVGLWVQRTFSAKHRCLRAKDCPRDTWLDLEAEIAYEEKEKCRE